MDVKRASGRITNGATSIAEQARRAATQRRAREASAVAASLTVAASWPKGPERDQFERELVEIIEDILDRPDRKIAHIPRILIGGEVARFLQALKEHRDDLIALLDRTAQVAANCIGLELEPDPERHRFFSELLASTQRIPWVRVPLLRLIDIADRRLQLVPQRHRVRALVLRSDDKRPAEVVTLAVSRKLGPRIPSMIPTSGHIKTALQTGWADESAFDDVKPPRAYVLDQPYVPTDGYSLGLPTLIAAVVASHGGDARGVVSTGGGPKGPFQPLSQVDVKRAALRVYNEQSGVRLSRFAVSNDEVFIEGDDVCRVGDVEHVADLLSKTVGFEILRAYNEPVDDPPDDATVPASVIAQIERHLTRAFCRGVVVVGETGAGKTTLCKTLAARWPGRDAASRRISIMTRREAPKAALVRLNSRLGPPATASEFHQILNSTNRMLAARDDDLEVVWLMTDVRPDDLTELLDALAALDVQSGRAATARLALRVILCLRPGEYRRHRSRVDSLTWPVIPALELNDRELEQLEVPDLLRDVCRLGYVWSAYEEVRLQDTTPYALARAVAGAHRARLENSDGLVTPAWEAAVDAVCAQRATHIALSGDHAHVLAARELAHALETSLEVFGDWYLELCVADRLARSERFDAAFVERWLKEIPATEIFEDGLRRAMALAVSLRVGRHLEPDLLRALAAVPSTAEIAAIAAFEVQRYFPDGAEQGWTQLIEGLRRAPIECWLSALAALPHPARAPRLVAITLRHLDPDIRDAGRLALQRALRRVTASGDSPEPILAILRKQAEELRPFSGPTVGLWRRWRPRPILPILYVIESCMVVVPEAARAERADLYPAYASGLADLVRSLRSDSFVMRTASSDAATVALRPGAMIDSWFNKTRSHNPFHRRKDFRRFFALPRTERERLRPLSALVRTDRAADAADHLQRVERASEKVQVPELAYAAVNTVVEAAWGSIVLGSNAALRERVITRLEQRYHHLIDNEATWIFAQSCLFSMFRALWPADDSLGVAAVGHVDLFDRLVAHWHRRTSGGKFAGNAGEEICIQHLFRAAALSLRIRGTLGSAFPSCIGADYMDAERQVDEIGSLAEECHHWTAARRLLRELVNRASPSARKKIRSAGKRQRKRIKRHDPAEAARWKQIMKGEGDPDEVDEHATDAGAMVGLSLAFEDAVYSLLDRDQDFRRVYGDWLDGTIECKSLDRWMVRGFDLVRTELLKTRT